MVTHFDLAATCQLVRCSTVNGYTSLNRVRISSTVFLWQSPSDVKQEKQMSSILDDQLRLMALKQYGLIESIKTPDISEADLTLILKNTEYETIEQLATEQLQHLNSQAIQNNLNLYHKFYDLKGMAAYRARTQSVNELKNRYKNASPDEKVKILDILYNAN